MQHNLIDERIKKVRSEWKRYWEIDTREYIPVALEYPQFAGWDVCVGLNESANKHPKAGLYLDVLRLMGWDKPVFIRNLTQIRLLRKAKYSYEKYQGKENKWNYQLKRFYDDIITVKTYNTLSEVQSRLFDKTKKAYRLRHDALPMHDLEFKVMKVFWKSLLHPNGEKISEYTKLHNKFYRGSYRRYKGKAFIRDYYSFNKRDNFTISIKAKWKTATRMLRKGYDEGLRDEDFDQVLQLYKVYDKKDYGYYW